MIKKEIWVVMFCLYLCVFSGCSKEYIKEEQKYSQDIFAMDTYMTITAYGEEADTAVAKSIEEIQRLETLLSVTDESSEIYAINANGEGMLSEDCIYLLERSLELYQDTKGAFNAAICPVMKEWGFLDDDFSVPGKEKLQEKLQLADVSKIAYNQGSRYIKFKKEGMAIDFGGIAKGYASTKIAEIYTDLGIKSGLINLGGNVQVVGRKTDGTKWNIAIQSPTDEQEYIGILAAEDCAVVTSGGYERYFEQDGVIYHHIIDPLTGYPAENGLVSVSVVSSDGTLADGLSTALFVMGKENAIQYWQKNSSVFDAILLMDDGTIYVTEGIAEAFSSKQEISIIKKEE